MKGWGGRAGVEESDAPHPRRRLRLGRERRGENNEAKRESAEMPHPSPFRQGAGHSVNRVPERCAIALSIYRSRDTIDDADGRC